MKNLIKTALTNIDHNIPFFVLNSEYNIEHISENFSNHYGIKSTQVKETMSFIELLKLIGPFEETELNTIYEQIKVNKEYLIRLKDNIFHLIPRSMKNKNGQIVLMLKSSAIYSLNEELKKEDELLNIINYIFQDISDNIDLGSFLQKVVNRLYISEFPYYHVAIFLLDDSGEYIYLASLEGENKEFFQKNFPDGYFQSVSIGIIGRALQTGENQVIPDVKLDPDYHEFKQSKTVSEICIPIISDHNIIGVINIESLEVYSPDEIEIRMLENIAHYLGMAIGNKMLVFELNKKQEEMEKYIVELQEAKERIENQTFDIIESMEEIEEARKFIEKQNRIMQSELEMAGNLQKKLLPAYPDIKNLKLGIWFEPSASLGGDFFDFRVLDENQLLFIQVDVTGHGVSSALLAAMSKIAFQNASYNCSSPGELLKELNVEFRNLNDTDLFFSAFAGLIDTKNRILQYSNAAHPFPLLFKQNKIIELDTDGFLVGVMPDMEYENKSIKFENGDMLVVYTDGLVEARDAHNNQYGIKKLKQLIKKEIKNLDIGELLMNLVDDIKSFSSATLEDDLTILGFKIEE